MTPLWASAGLSAPVVEERTGRRRIRRRRCAVRVRCNSDYGDLVVDGRTFLTAISCFRPVESLAVKEVFAEFNAPLLADKPFARELSIQGAGRFAEYKGNIGEVFARNGGVSWSPIDDLRFRANYSVAVRAPTQFDLYAELGQNFNQLSDPCDVNNISNGSATRIANCAAAGIPAGFVNSAARSSSTAFAVGGNPFLKEEEWSSWTVGFVSQPQFVPGFTLTVDYYDINISSVIGAPTAQQILDNCYDSASLDNVFCAVIRRDPASKFFSTAAPEYGLIRGGINFAASTARGIDFEAVYKRDIERIGGFTARLIGTKVTDRDDFPFISQPTRPDQQLLEVGDPELELQLSLSLKRCAWTFGYQGRYFSKQAVASVTLGGGIEDIRSIRGRAPQNPDFADLEFYSPTTHHDFRVGYDFNEKLKAYAGVDNAFDKLPPYGLLGNGGTYAADAIWDNTGRYFYVGATYNF